MGLPQRVVSNIKTETSFLLEQRLSENEKMLRLKNHELSTLQTKVDSLELKWINNEVGADTYHKWHDEFSQKLLQLKQETSKLKHGEDEIRFLLQGELSKLSDLEYVYSSATIPQGQELLRRVFDSRLYYQKGIYRTPYMMSIFHRSTLILSEKKLLEMDNEETGP
jgi:hypothetical protein